MALTRTTTGQHALAHGVKCCVYGRSGAGKTRLIATAPKPVIFSAEAGTLSIAKANITMYEIHTLAELQEAYAWAATSQEARQFETICLDSITEIAERLLSEERKKNKDPRQAYGEMMDQIAVAIRLFRDLPGFNVYFTAKAELRNMPDGKVMWAGSMPGNKTAQGLPFYFDEFFYLGVGELSTPDPTNPAVKAQYRYLLTRQDNQYEAKDRSGSLDVMEPPDLNHIFNKIRTSVRA